VRAENFGIIDLAGIPKDDYFLYKSFWTTVPMVHLLPHWTHPGMNGVPIPVVAYSNHSWGIEGGSLQRGRQSRRDRCIQIRRRARGNPA
jgi:hypothetical protein